MGRFSASPCQVLVCLLLTIACSLRAASPVYVGASYGLFKSADAGTTWTLLNIPLNSPFLSGTLLPLFLGMDRQNPSKIYFIGHATGTAFFASSDAGQTWSITPFVGMQPTHLAVDFAGQAIYISATTSSNGIASLYKSTNTGATWTRLTLPSTSQEPSGSSVNTVFADPTVSGTVYFVSANGNHFFKSKDFGTTWTEIIQSAFKRPSYVDPHNPLIWYDADGTGGLFKSTDGAATFTALNIPSDRVTSVSVGAVSTTVYAAGDVAGLGGTVLKSTDGGATWTALKNGLFTGISGVVWADPVDASTVCVNDSIYPGSFYVSTDAGGHFNQSKIPPGPPGCVPGNCQQQEIFDLLIAPSIAAPPVITSVVNGASFQPGVVANSWVTIQGIGLAPNTDDWSNSIVNGTLPTSLDGVSVTMGGKPAVTINNGPATVYGAALTPGFGGLYQIAIQVPASVPNGDWPIQATIGGVASPAGVVLTVQR